jgi:hypothetical protein
LALSNKVKMLEKDLPVLVWESSDSIDKYDFNIMENVSDMLRWSVLSSTVDQLSKKLGIGISES